jgi:STE24 endopeptidase
MGTGAPLLLSASEETWYGALGVTPPIFTPEQLAEVKAYARPYYVAMVFSDVFNIALNLLLLRFTVAPLYRAAGRVVERGARFGGRVRRTPVLRAFPAVLDKLWNGPGWAQALLFTFFNMVVVELAAMPVFLYFQYFHERAYGLSNYTPLTFAWDVFKSYGVNTLVISMLTIGVYGLARRMRLWWLVLGVVAGAGTFVSEALDAYRSRLTFEQSSMPAGPLRAQLEELLHRGDIEFSDIVVQKTSRASKKVDVWLAGRGASRKVIITDEFLAQFPPDEVVAGVAHEAGHVKQPRALGRIASFLAIIGFLFLVDRIFRWTPRKGWWGIRDVADIRTLPVIFFAFNLISDFAAPLSAVYGREGERDADHFAVRMTHDPAAFERMLVRAARLNKSDPDPPQWIVWLGMSHPPIGERIAWAEEQREKLGSAGSASP